MKKLILKRIFILGLLVFAFSCQPETPETPSNQETPETPETPVVEGKVTLGQGVPATGIALESTVSTATFTISATKAWTSSVSANWLSIRPESGEAGESITITLTSQANETGDSRTANITVSCEKSTVTVPVTQVQNNVMVLDNQTFSVAAAGETINLPFKSNVQVTPSSDVAWITVAQTKAVEDHIFSITVAANDAYEGREGHVTFTSDAGNAVITVKQEAAEEPSDGIIRILAIGNSFSQDAVEQYLWNLFNAAGKKVIIGDLYIGGCSLETHYNNSQSDAADYYYRKIVDGEKTETRSSLAAGLEDEKWDYVSFQQVSGLSGQAETYEPYLGNLITYVKGKVGEKATLLLHQTWAYATTSDHSDFSKYDKNQMTMYNAIMSAGQTAMAAHSELKAVVPCGTAIQNGRTTWLGDTFNRDGYHLEVTYGRFTAACTWYETITGESVLNTTWHHENIDDTLAEICRAAAHAACAKPWEVTELTDYKTPTTQDPDFTVPVQIDFGAGTTATPAGWSRVPVYSTTDPVFLKNAEDKYASISITGLTGFTANYNGVGGEVDQELTINGVNYPKGVWYDGIMIGGTKNQGDVGPAVVTISGFDPSLTYDLTIIAVRWNGSAAARISEYKVIGKTESEAKSINTGLKNISATDGNFDGFGVSFTGVAPASDGTIKVSIIGKDTTLAADGHINALTIKKAQ